MLADFAVNVADDANAKLFVTKLKSNKRKWLKM